MKKFLLLSVGILAAYMPVIAQNNKIRTAEEYLSDNNYKKAIPAIDEAVANESTKNSARAWYVRGRAYLAKALDTTANSPDAADIATNSFIKVLQISPDYESEIDNPMYSTAIIAFNAGVAAFQNKAYADAYNSFSKVANIGNANKRLGKLPAFRTLAQNAKLNAAYAAMNNKQYDDAAKLLEEINAGLSLQKDSNVYMNLVQIYSEQKNNDKLGKILTEARGEFPNSTYFRDQELNYLINTGRQGELLGKLEEASKQDPNNPEILFNLANGYQKASAPVDQTGKDMPAPANAAELSSKAEAAYLRLIGMVPNNADYNYNTAIVYYKRAAAINKQLMDIKGTSPAEQKRYDELVAARNAQFDKALPYFEKAYSLLDGKTLTNDSDKDTYRNSMVGLREIYSRKNNKAKADEFSKKISALNK